MSEDGITFLQEVSDPLSLVKEREERLLRDAVEICNRAGFDMTLDEIEVVEFENVNILGKASKERISVARRVLSMGMRELLSTLFEEWAHRKSAGGDYTHKFQNFLIDRLIELVAKGEDAQW